MQFINFCTKEDKNAITPEQLKIITNLELNNPYGDETYVAMVNRNFESRASAFTGKKECMLL